jgi:exodeoxyribonuclease-5
MKNIILGEDQEKAFNMVKDFVNDHKDIACLYYGSAGTGKSILVNYIIKWCEQQDIEYTLCAPTHKAALVISRYTNREAITLHKLLALSPNLDIFMLDFRNLMFKCGNTNGSMPYKGVIICDESSMINDDLYEVLLTKAQEFKSQIIFTGDFCQLQPVKQDSLTKIIHTKPSIELQKIYRQSDKSGLLDVLQTLRKHSILRFDNSIGEDGSLLVTSNMSEFLKEAKIEIEKALKESDVLKTKILCYTNERVQAYNAGFHKALFGEDCQYHKNEFLIGCENLEFNNFKFYNSMDYVIINEPEKIDLGIPNFGILPAIRLELYDSLTKSSGNIAMLSKDISKDYLDMLAYKIEEFRQSAISSKQAGNKAQANKYWRRYFEMVESFTTPIDLYVDGRLIRKKSFDYSYAISTHKAQGSTYDSVFVDIRNINSCRDEAVRRQLQYVALSRTKKNVLIYQ